MKHKRLVILLAVCIPIIIVGIVSNSIIQTCNQKNEIPLVDLYPNSQVVDRTIREFGSRRMATLKYWTSASDSELIAYFDERLDCNTDETRTKATCRGILPNSNNEYFIYVSPDYTVQELEISYISEIFWRGCNWDFQMYE